MTRNRISIFKTAVAKLAILTKLSQSLKTAGGNAAGRVPTLLDARAETKD